MINQPSKGKYTTIGSGEIHSLITGKNTLPQTFYLLNPEVKGTPFSGSEYCLLWYIESSEVSKDYYAELTSVSTGIKFNNYKDGKASWSGWKLIGGGGGGGGIVIETDPIYTSDKSSIALKSEIATAVAGINTNLTTNYMTSTAIHTAIDAAVRGLYNFKGNVPTTADLPTTAADYDMYYINDIGELAFAFNTSTGLKWSSATPTIDLSAYALTADVDAKDYNVENNAKSYTDYVASTKVDKIAGMGLSSNDFTNADKTQIVNNTTSISLIHTDIANTNSRVSDIEALIPIEATPTNQLADKDYVSSVVTNMIANRVTFNTIGSPFPTYSALSTATNFYHQGVLYTPVERDYTLVNADETAPAPFTNGQTRYEFDGTNWVYAYGIQDRPFTPDEQAALDSGINSALVDAIKSAETELDAVGTRILCDKNNIPWFALPCETAISLQKASYPELYTVVGDRYNTSMIAVDMPQMTSNTTPTPYTITASGYQTGGAYNYMPWRAFVDGADKKNIRWISSGGTQIHWIKVDFGGLKTLDQVKMAVSTESYPAQAMQDFNITVTLEDGTTEQLYSTTNFGFPNSLALFDIPITKPSQKISALMIANNTPKPTQSLRYINLTFLEPAITSADFEIAPFTIAHTDPNLVTCIIAKPVSAIYSKLSGGSAVNTNYLRSTEQDTGYKDHLGRTIYRYTYIFSSLVLSNTPNQRIILEPSFHVTKRIFGVDSNFSYLRMDGYGIALQVPYVLSPVSTNNNMRTCSVFVAESKTSSDSDRDLVIEFNYSPNDSGIGGVISGGIVTVLYAKP